MQQDRAKKVRSYANLQKQLMSKLEQAAQFGGGRELDELGFPITLQEPSQQMGPPNPLSGLILRAKQVTQKNQEKLAEAKKSVRSEKKNTFLTGVNICQPERELPVSDEKPEEQKPGDINLLFQVSAIRTDDLEELRRMIRDTGERLDDYGRDLFKTKSQVMDAAGRFGKGPSSKSSVKLRPSRYGEHLPPIEQRFTATTKRKFSSVKSKMTRLPS